MKTKIQKIARNNNLRTVKIKTEFNRLGTLKTLVIIALILLQAVVLLSSYLFLFLVFKWISIFSIIATIVACVHCLSTEKNAQAKGTWIFLMLLCFTFGYLIYFLSNEKVLFRSSKIKYRKIFNQTKTFNEPQKDLSSASIDLKNDSNYLFNAGDFPAYNSLNTTYFPSGYTFYESLIEELKNAQKFIFMEFFICSDGVLINRILKVLKQKVNEGVDVRIIYDDMGSHGTLSRKTKNKIIKTGIKLKAYNRFVPIFNISLYFRDHRKIVVIDGKIGYTGGVNLADEYINEKRMHGYWKDTGIKIEGRAVNTFTLAFLRQWQFLTKKPEDYSPFLNSTIEPPTSSIVVPFVDGPDYTEPIGRNAYINMISSATQKIYIMTPYFIPDDTITDLLKSKARAGVDVRIIIPDVADKKFVYKVTRNNAERLIEYGVKVYAMQHSFVHSKICLTENSTIVGSINFDQRSFYHQFESAVYTNDQQVLKSVNKDFNKTIEYSKLLSKTNSLANRIVTGFLRIISPFM